MAAAILERVQAQPTTLRWSRERYYSAVDAGVIGEDEKVELIGGELVMEGMADRMAQRSLHGWAVIAVAEVLGPIFGSEYHIRQQLPLSLGLDSDPEPDDAVIKGSFHDYRDAHPTTAALIVEVSDSTLRYDRQVKSSLYASAGIDDYWILNIADNRLEVHRDPVQDMDERFGFRYASIVTLRAGDLISPLAVPAIALPVASLLP